MKISPVGA